MSDARTLPNHVTAPPGGWRYKVPETGQLFTGVSEHQLVSQIQAHYKANGYPIPDIELIKGRIETFICSTIPEHCTGNGPEVPNPEGFSFHTVLQGMKTLLVWSAKSGLKGERLFVSDALAKQRAETCLSCPFNDQPQGCTGCNSGVMKAALKLIIGSKTGPYDDVLKSCRVCQCNLSAKVKLPHSVLWPNMTDEQKAKLPAACWLVKENIQVDDQSTTHA